MENTHGYNPLSWQLIRLFQSGAPDFEAAEKLIDQGADINDQGDDKEENVLSEIIQGYWDSGACNLMFDECPNERMDYYNCPMCKHNSNPNVGASMIRIINFFLNHGFDVTRNDGNHGRQCLRAIALSSFDENILLGTKLLLDAYRGNIPPMNDPDEGPMYAIANECSSQYPLDEDWPLGNIFDTVYQIYVALEKGHPYSGIDLYGKAMGHEIKRVLMGYKERVPKFSEELMRRPKGYFYGTLYFMFDEGYLISTKTASYWVDKYLPLENTVDVSEFFAPIIGDTLQQLEYEHNVVIRDTYHRPAVTLHFGKGTKVKLTDNIGEVEIEQM